MRRAALRGLCLCQRFRNGVGGAVGERQISPLCAPWPRWCSTTATASVAAPTATTPTAALLREECSEILSEANTVSQRMRVDAKEDTVQLDGGGSFATNLRWSWWSSAGQSEEVTSGEGNSKQMARSVAALRMLQRLGLREDVQPEHRVESNRIKELLAQQSVDEAVSYAVDLISRTDRGVWSLFLKELWREAMAESSIDCNVARLQNLCNAISLRGSETMLHSSMWESLLVGACLVTNADVGKQALSMLRDVEVDPTSFFSEESKNYYCQWRQLQAVENFSDLSARFQRIKTETPDMCAVAQAKDGAFPLMSFVVDTRAEQRYPDLLEMRSDDVILVRPCPINGEVTNDESEWVNCYFANVVSVSRPTYTDGNMGITVRCLSREPIRRSDSLTATYVYIYPLGGMISEIRMSQAVAALTQARFPIAEKTPPGAFSSAMRYMLFHSRDLNARDVAKVGEVPVDTYGPSEPMPTNSDVDLRTQVPLSEVQHQVLLSAMTNRLSLIQGPPGTGKTHVACAVIDCWRRNFPADKVMAVADSNVAADNLALGLRKHGIDALRVGSGSEIEDYQDEMISDIRGYQNYLNITDPKEKKAARFLLMQRAVREKPVVIATCIGAGHEIFHGEIYPRILLDEATQSIEPTNVVPLALRAKQIVLIGDHKQLPPTILTSNRESESLLPYSLYRKLTVSLFERFVESGITDVHFLDTQRRMHPSISYFPNRFFYNGRMGDADVGDDVRPPIGGFQWPNPSCRVCLVDTGVSFPENKTGVAIDNPGELRVIVDILCSVLNSGSLQAAQIAIITPYYQQKVAIRHTLRSLTHYPNMRDVKVDTIDGFQGMERDLVLFSAVRSNAEGNVGFLRDPRRMNVMLTRARRGVIVVGDQSTLRNERDYWSPWVDWIRDCGCIIPISMLSNHIEASQQHISPY